MKKVSFLFVVAGIALFVACGPSKKEKEAAIEKAKQDSIANIGKKKPAKGKTMKKK